MKVEWRRAGGSTRRSRERRCVVVSSIWDLAKAFFGSCGSSGPPKQQLGPGAQSATTTTTTTFISSFECI